VADCVKERRAEGVLVRRARVAEVRRDCIVVVVVCVFGIMAMNVVFCGLAP
jgi:hypothetical protein